MASQISASHITAKASEKALQCATVPSRSSQPLRITSLLQHGSLVLQQSKGLQTSLQSISPTLPLTYQSNAAASRTKEKRPFAARAPFSDGGRNSGVGKNSPGVPKARSSRRARQGRTLLLQSVLYSKQVITRTSGRNLGVVCQLWVDTVKVSVMLDTLLLENPLSST